VRRRSVTSLGETAGDGNSASPATEAEQGTLTTGQVPAVVQVTGTGSGSAQQSTSRSGISARPPAGSRFAISNWRVRWRLAAVIAIPTITAAILGGIQIGSDLSSSEAAGRVLHLTELNAAVITLTQDLENERDYSAGFIAAGRGQAGTPSTSMVGTLKTDYAQTASAIKVVQSEAAGVTTGDGYQSTTVQDLDALLSSVENDLPYIETVVQKTNLPAPNAIQVYTDNIIDSANTFTGAVGDGSNDPQLQSNLTTLTALMRIENQMSVQRAILFAALNATPATLGNQELSDLEQSYQQEQAEIGDFDASTSVAEAQLYGNTVSGTQVDAASGDETLAESLAASAPNTSLTANQKLTPSNWNRDMSATILDAEQVANGPQGLVGAISSRANTLKSHWGAELLWTTLITFLLLIIVLVMSTIVARSLTRPLRKLRSDALDVAGHRLPDVVRRLSQSEGADEGVEIEPIGVNSTDEIGEVARAFDQVHREAVRLAADEAMLRGNLNAMFINLSRRSQSLIERQLSLIDSLEQSEQDSGRLSSLFRLDHLATRMRRNSENLLVLAGHEVARRWSQPVPLVDVLRAAISEIEQYERVVLNVQPGIVVVGQAVNDAVHLVAEIVENATTFSPEDTQVYVSGQPLSSGGVLLDITDNGVGISDQEMSHANWRLDNPPVVDVAVSRRMGLFVVGRLAARHGVRVRLRHAQAGGLTALIWLPETVAAPEVAPPLGRLRRFEADDYGPTPSLSAPTPTSSAAASQATAAARIPRFSSPSPSTSPSFTPSNSGTGPAGPTTPFPPLPPLPSQPAGPQNQPPVPPLPVRSNGTAQPVNGLSGRPEGAGTGPSTPSTPDFSGPAAASFPGLGQHDDLTGLPVPTRLPSFGGGQPPAQGGSVHGGDGWSAQDMTDDLDTAASVSGLGAPSSALPNFEPSYESNFEPSYESNGNGGANGTNGNGSQNGGGTQEVTIPPASAQDQRLPIFDSLESDWFRRSGKSMTANRGTGPQPQLQPAQAAAWTSPADEGWRAAEVVATPAAGETTQAGLPKRVPRANLVPGSVGGGDHEGTAPQSAPARTAEDIRSRMSSLQRGVREGRAAAPQNEEQ
jgi:signal transduction histidine kinase